MPPSQSIIHTQDSYGLRPEASAFPMMLVLSFVYPCNAHCPHCPYTNSNIRKEYQDAPFMPAPLFRKIADEAGRYGALLRISGGGEPMLHPEATDLLVYAKAAGAQIGLITNGSRFDEESTRRLIAAGVDMIEISVDACTAEDYARVRPGLKWQVLVDTVRRMVAMRRSAGSASKIVCSAVSQQGIDIDRVEEFWVGTIGVDALIKRKFLTWGSNTSLDDSRSADPAPYLDTGETPCPFIFERLNIDSRGNVMVCGYDIAGRTSMGNVTNQSISDIWLGPEFELYREKHLTGRGTELALCAECPDWKYRSWQHNYWKVMATADQARARKIAEMDAADAV